jgi:hypothetical protein
VEKYLTFVVDFTKGKESLIILTWNSGPNLE